MRIWAIVLFVVSNRIALHFIHILNRELSEMSLVKSVNVFSEYRFVRLSLSSSTSLFRYANCLEFHENANDVSTEFSLSRHTKSKSLRTAMALLQYVRFASHRKSHFLVLNMNTIYRIFNMNYVRYNGWL